MKMPSPNILPAFVALSACMLVSSPSYSQEFPLRAMNEGTIDEETVYEASDFAILDDSGLIWQETIEKLGAKHMRLHFAEFANPDGESFEMIIRAGSQQRIRYTEGTLPGENFWSPMLRGNTALIQVTAEVAPRTMQFKIDKVAYQSPGGSWESIIDDPDFEEINAYKSNDDITRVGNAIAKLTFFDNGYDSCTGFMISPNRLMTNHHCVSTLEICETTMAIFGFQKNENGDEVYGNQYACENVVTVDYELDFAVLEFQDNPGDKYGFLPFINADVTSDQSVYIIQHADGKPKQIVINNCDVLDAVIDGRGPTSDFSHTCDTLGGSSGSPVMTVNHQVIGLHHFGIDQETYWDRNRAIRIPLILAKLAE